MSNGSPKTAYDRFTGWDAWADSAALSQKFLRKLTSGSVTFAGQTCSLKSLEDFIHATSVTNLIPIPPQQLIQYLTAGRRWWKTVNQSAAITPGLRRKLQGEKDGLHLIVGLNGPMLIRIAQYLRVTIV